MDGAVNEHGRPRAERTTRIRVVALFTDNARPGLPNSSDTTPMTVRTAQATINSIDALAEAMHRSRNYVVNEAIAEYMATKQWQLERIQAGLEDARNGRVVPAEQVFAEIAAEHGWDHKCG